MKKRLFSILLVILATPLDALAECPRGTQAYTPRESKTIYLSWSDDSKWHLCKNLTFPERNNARDSFGYDYGPAEYKCGDFMTANGYIRSSVELMDRNGNNVRFDEVYGQWKVDQGELSCEDQGANVVCTRKDNIYNVLRNNNGQTSKVLNKLVVSKNIWTCPKVSF